MPMCFGATEMRFKFHGIVVPWLLLLASTVSTPQCADAGSANEGQAGWTYHSPVHPTWTGPHDDVRVFSMARVLGDDDGGEHLIGLRLGYGSWCDHTRDFLDSREFWLSVQRRARQVVTSLGLDSDPAHFAFGPGRAGIIFRPQIEHRSQAPHEGLGVGVGVGAEVACWIGKWAQLSATAVRSFTVPAGATTQYVFAVRVTTTVGELKFPSD